MGLLGGDTPDLQVAELDPGTQAMVKSIRDEARQDDAGVGAKYNQGVAQTAGQAHQSDDAGNQRAAGTGENASMAEAIRRQYRGIGGGQISNITRGNELATPMNRAHALDLAVKARFAQTQVDTQNSAMLLQANTNAEMARAQTLYGVLSGTGTLAGAYMGSRGPSGPSSRRPMTPSDQTINEFNGPQSDYSNTRGPTPGMV